MDIDDVRGNPLLKDKYEKVIQKFLDFLEENQREVNKLNEKSKLTINDLRAPKAPNPTAP
jgi:hypothetical protein